MMTYTTYPNATNTNGNTQNAGQQTPGYTNQNGLNPGLNSGLNTGPNFGTQGTTPGYFGGQNPFTQNYNPQNYGFQNYGFPSTTSQNYGFQNYGFQNSFPQNWFSQIPTQGFFGQTPWQTPFNTYFPANYTPFSGTYGTPSFFPVNTGWNTTGAFGFYPSGYSNSFAQYGNQFGNQFGGQYTPVQYGSSTPWNTTIPTFSWSPFNTAPFNGTPFNTAPFNAVQNFRTPGFTAFNTPSGQYTPFNQYGLFNTYSPTTGQYGLFGGQYSTPFNTFGGYTPSNFFNSYPTGFSGTPNFFSGLQGFPQNFGGTYSWSPANSVYGTTPWSFDGGYGWNSTPTNTFGGYNTIPFGATGGTFINGGTFLNGTTPFGYSNSWQNAWNTPAAFGGIYFPSSYVPGFTTQGYVQNALQGYQHGFHQGYQPVGQTQGGLQPSTFVQHAGDCCGIRQAA